MNPPAAGQLPQRRLVSANLDVLIVGVGSIGERHVRCFQGTGRARVAVCEVNGTLRDRIAAQYGISRSYADLDAALADRHDAAVIATPAHLHLAMATQACDAGLHLLIEKPLSTQLDGIAALEQALLKRSRVVAVAYVLRHHPILRALKKLLASGQFGHPVQLVATSGQNFPTYRPAYREIYYKAHATGGGAIQDALTHLINAGQWLVGPLDWVMADAAHQVLEGVAVEDTVHVIGRHNGVLATYSLNQHQAPNEFTITVVCTRGTCRAELHQQRLRWMTQPDSPWQEQTFDGIERDALFVAQANAFLDMIERQAEPVCSLSAAVSTLRANLAILASVEKRKLMRLNDLASRPC